MNAVERLRRGSRATATPGAGCLVVLYACLSWRFGPCRRVGRRWRCIHSLDSAVTIQDNTILRALTCAPTGVMLQPQPLQTMRGD